jgi:hypothetical protein
MREREREREGERERERERERKRESIEHIYLQVFGNNANVMTQTVEEEYADGFLKHQSERLSNLTDI